MSTERPSVSNEVLRDRVWEQAAGPIVVLDLEGFHVDINPAFARMLGYDKETLLNLCPADVTHPHDTTLDRELIAKMVEGSIEEFSVEKRLYHSRGSIIWVLINSSLVRGTAGEPELVVSQFHDITACRESELLWRRTLTNAPIGMGLLNLEGRWTEVNDKLCELVGYRRDQLLGMHLTDLAYQDKDKAAEPMLTSLRRGKADMGNLELRFRHSDGHPFWVLIRFSVVPGVDDQPAYFVSQCEALSGDVRLSSERVLELTHMALHDPLTGLANRTLLIDRFEHELAELSESGGALMVLVIDLDEFKPVNDRYGHAIGDQFLKTAAYEISSAVRCSDTVARTGGDEFVVLTRVVDDLEAEALRDRVRQRLNTELVLSPGQQATMGASVGLATTRNSSAPPQALLESADHDMFLHKRGC